MKKLTLAGLVVLISTGAGPALAHSGHGATTGLIAGLAHPVFGLDHLLAMLAVGLWSGFVLPRRFWLGAAVFMAAMVVGAALSWAGIALPFVEAGIVASVVLFGAARAGGADHKRVAGGDWWICDVPRSCPRDRGGGGDPALSRGVPDGDRCAASGRYRHRACRCRAAIGAEGHGRRHRRLGPLARVRVRGGMP